MALIPGNRIGVYEVTTQLGVGGMGEVYRATDTKLKRQVAIKILPSSLAADLDRLARFQREAEVLASLNHPNIAAIYGLEDADGVKALVLELVEGPTLADRIAHGPIPVDEALPVARQIAEAIEAAHQQGIIHRDLKPANIKVRADGTVKVLDFGLAKALAPEQDALSATHQSQSPTITSPAMLTGAGIVLGTAAYMAPEQAKGREADKRSDIWAFGCVLYEMLTGRRAFDADDIVVTLAAVISSEPNWAILPAAVPTPIRRLLRRCLEKDLKRRLPDFVVARLEIDDALMLGSGDATAIGASETGEPRTRWRGLVPLVTVGTLMAVAGGLATSAIRRPTLTRPSPLTRFAITLPSAQALESKMDGSVLALSADGTHLVYIAAAQSQLMLRALDRLDSVPLRGIVDARDPFFSPDGRAIGFFDRDTLRKVSITGAPPIALCRLSGRSRGASWGTDDTIVFATSDTSSGLLSVPVGGGEPKVLTKPDAQRGEQDHFFPSVLPGGRSVLFTVVSGVGAEPSYVAILDLQTGQYRKLISQGGRAEYVETGYLIYEAARTIWAVRFDLSTQQVLGDPVPVVERLAGRNFSVSRQGTLVYTPANAPGGPLVWVSREGHEDPIAAPPRAYLYPRLSPDGSRVAARITEQELHIWIWDFSRQALTRLTLEPGITTYPLWAGDHIIFTSSRSGAANPCLPATQIVPCFQRLPAQGDFTSEPNLGPSRFEYERHPPPR